MTTSRRCINTQDDGYEGEQLLPAGFPFFNAVILNGTPRAWCRDVRLPAGSVSPSAGRQVSEGSRERKGTNEDREGAAASMTCV